MLVSRRLSGVGRTRAALGLTAVATVWALSVTSPGTAGASPGASPGLKQHAELTASGGAAGDAFGRSVAVSGSIAVVGAPYRNSSTGAAYVFVRSGTTWSQQAELTASDGASGDEFGYSVAVSGSTVVVGAIGRNSFAGAVYVFVGSGGTWSQQAELTASDGAQSDEFGWAVAASGTTAVVGAPHHDLSDGAAYVFLRSGTTWSQQAELTASDASSGSQLGYSTALSGTTALVGAAFDNSDTGAAYVFVGSGASWSQQAELTAGTDGAFGYAVAVSGSTAVVGAPFGNNASGAAYAFARSGTTWSQQAALTGGTEGAFGFSVAVSKSTAVVSAPAVHSATGKAFVFVRSGANWSPRTRLAASDAAAGDEVGYSVSMSGSTALVGAPFHISSTGAAYVFALP